MFVFFFSHLDFSLDKVSSLPSVSPESSYGSSILMYFLLLQSLCLSRLSAAITALAADHFRPLFISTPAVLTYSSAEPVRIITSLVFLALNSSTTDVNGRCDLVVLLNCPMNLKLDTCSTHSHFDNLFFYPLLCRQDDLVEQR